MIMAADKRELILEAAIRLFAEKGFHSTSIQEIADAAGVAKGSTYIYFKSKDDIMLSIFKDYYVKVFDDIMNATAPELTPREHLRVRVKMQLEKFKEFRNFIKMQLREQFIHQNEEVKEAARRMRIRGIFWLHERIVEIYGERIRLHAVDLTMLVNSMIAGYMNAMIMNGVEFDLERLSVFLIQRLDDLAEGVMRRGEEPFMQEKDWEEFVCEYPVEEQGAKVRLLQLYGQVRELAGQHPDGAAEDLLSSLQVLEEELEKPEPKRVIVQGMLSMLQQCGMPGMKKLVKQLQAEAASMLERGKE